MCDLGCSLWQRTEEGVKGLQAWRRRPDRRLFQLSGDRALPAPQLSADCSGVSLQGRKVGGDCHEGGRRLRGDGRSVTGLLTGVLGSPTRRAAGLAVGLTELGVLLASSEFRASLSVSCAEAGLLPFTPCSQCSGGPHLPFGASEHAVTETMGGVKGLGGRRELDGSIPGKEEP